MKQKYKTKNNSRHDSIVRQCYEASVRESWFGLYTFSYDLGMRIIRMLSIDKYDVIVAVCSCHKRQITTFARGDIRYRNPTIELPEHLLMDLAIALLIVMFRFQL